VMSAVNARETATVLRLRHGRQATVFRASPTADESARQPRLQQPQQMQRLAMSGSQGRWPPFKSPVISRR